ncbi:MAG: methylthioribulose 1-phosphate dehydratase [Bacteroidota bacterium]|jgi:methylthioribulose-1-phosphate dehydratase
MKEIPAFAAELADCIRSLHNQGHSPATSTNYSFKDDSDQLWVSRSGIDKSSCLDTDFITIDAQGKTQAPYEHMTPSAETGIHCAIYEMFPTTKVILHSHDLYPVLVAHNKNSLNFEGFELQKGFPSVTTHLGKIHIPVFPNSQDMNDIKHCMESREEELQYQVFMIDKHGFYTWGTSLFEAKRILESFSYLCKASWYLTN